VADYVVDASAVVAFLKPEPYTIDLDALFEGSIISTANLSESADFFARKGLNRATIETMLGKLAMQIVPVDAELALDAAMLRPVDKTSSLADRCCVSLAKRLGLPVLTGDRPMAKVADAAGVELVLIR
jgi:ribonuclease VapC